MAVKGTPSSSPATANPADTDASADGLDKEIDALNFRLKALKNRRTSTRPPTSGRQQQQQQPRSGPPRFTPACDPNFKCRYCKKLGHGQYECNSRPTAGAPMVAADGTPYKPAAQQACVHQVVESPLTLAPQLGYPQGYPPRLPPGLPSGLRCCAPILSGFSLCRVNDSVRSLCSIEPTCNILNCNKKLNFSKTLKNVQLLFKEPSSIF